MKENYILNIVMFRINLLLLSMKIAFKRLLLILVAF